MGATKTDASPRSTRREWLAAAAQTTGAAALAAANPWGLPMLAAAEPAAASEAPRPLPRVAAINTIYRHRSHAFHIAGRFIHGYARQGFHHQPPFQLVRMYNDQYPPDDLGVGVCERYGIERCDSVAAALGGASTLDVDAVLLIAEHGDYPMNEFGQILYPRFKLFEQIVDVFRASGRSVPVFNDKHLSYDHRLAQQMVATSRELDFGLMAGSSLPVTWRRPELELPLDTPIEEGLVCFGYDPARIEVYVFHALETLQCMMERRRGGESGVRRVTALVGDEVWKAADAGRWSLDLLQAALSRSSSRGIEPIRESVLNPLAVLIEYLDGTRGAIVNLYEYVSDFTFAARIARRSQPESTCFYLPAPPGAKYFDALVANIERFFAAGSPPYPIERTLLTTTISELAMRSKHAGGQPQESEALAIRYRAPEDSGYMRGRYTDAG